jgi:hypothetical protein
MQKMNCQEYVQNFWDGILVDPDPPIPPKKVPRKITFRLPGKTMKVKDYKDLLTKQLTELTAASPDEEIEVDFETL